ncbi:MAG: hypothetical protein GEV12_04920 [Micromonosporaceae bacterium]|nr:hypothetical protein [Micromonosporaceae bacterium]
MRDGYVARWQGVEYEASPDGASVRLYRPSPADGFTRVRDGRHVKVAAMSEIEDLRYVRTTCSWRGEPFIVLAEYESWLRVEYTGGKATVAGSLGLEEFEFGVYQGWVPAAEVTDLREYRV